MSVCLRDMGAKPAYDDFYDPSQGDDGAYFSSDNDTAGSRSAGRSASGSSASKGPARRGGAGAGGSYVGGRVAGGAGPQPKDGWADW
jgi:hypothetical protein